MDPTAKAGRDRNGPRTPKSRRPILAAFALALITFAIYGRVGDFAFTHFDDGVYVYENSVVLRGLSWEGLRWAWTTAHGSNWHPLTWMSHMADIEFFGLDAGGHHRVNVLLHVINAELLLWFWWRATGALWRSSVVAALFALHPLHVESVAWIAERKDVLSTLLALVSLHAYAHYARRPGLGRYVMVALPFGLGLLAKPMIVTLPFIFLLLDAWPLERAGPATPRPRRLLRRAVEKIPLFILSVAVSAVTYFVQTRGSFRLPLGDFPIGLRLANAVVAYAAYLGKTAWPTSLSVFYPHPGTVGDGIPLVLWASAALGLALISFAVTWYGRQRPYLSVGWWWFVGGLIPAVGLVQVGGQAMADRYTYLPLVGIFVIVAWCGAEILEALRVPRLAAGLATVAILAGLGRATWNQTGHWRNNSTLFTHALAVDERNWLAWNNLGLDNQIAGRVDQAIEQYREAIRIKPDYGTAWYNLGSALDELGQPIPARTAYLRAIEIWPTYAKAWQNLGVLQDQQGQPELAIDSYQAALRHAPESPETWYNLGLAYWKAGQPKSAERAFLQAIRFRPEFEAAWRDLGGLYQALQEPEKAADCVREWKKIREE